MNTNTRDAQSPESYATFWEPIVVDPPRVATQPEPKIDPNDAYQQFVNIAEEVPAVLHVEQV